MTESRPSHQLKRVVGFIVGVTAFLAEVPAAINTVASFEEDTGIVTYVAQFLIYLGVIGLFMMLCAVLGSALGGLLFRSKFGDVPGYVLAAVGAIVGVWLGATNADEIGAGLPSGEGAGVIESLPPTVQRFFWAAWGLLILIVGLRWLWRALSRTAPRGNTAA